jgi:hypothetical protein
MPSQKCPSCSLHNPESALRCDCGYDFQSGQIKESYLSKQQQDLEAEPSPVFFPVAIHEFVMLSVCTFGLYELYWFYKNWQWVKESQRSDLSPFWRAFFAPFWAYRHFCHVQERANAGGLVIKWNAGVLAILYFVLIPTWQLPDPLCLVSLGSFVPLLPVQQTINRINGSRSGSTYINSSYSGVNIAIIIIRRNLDRSSDSQYPFCQVTMTDVVNGGSQLRVSSTVVQ